MELAEMDKIAAQADRIRSAQRQLDDAQHRLALVNKHVKDGQHWDVMICIYRRPQYSGERDIDLRVALPGSYVQQQAVDQVKRAERDLTMAKLGL